MTKKFVIASVVSAALIGTSWAFWQEAAPSRPSSNPIPANGQSGSTPFAIPDSTVTLLRIREVQTELKLDENRAKKLDEIHAEATRERVKLFAEYNAKMAELNKISDTQSLSLLSEEQCRRAEQLRLQQQGLRAFSTNSVAEKLGLTQTQRDEIAKLNQRGSFFGKGSPRDQTADPPNPNASPQDRFQQAIEDANKRATETRDKILAVLTPEQKAKWSEMTGATFKFPSHQRSTSRGDGTNSSEPLKTGAEKKAQ